MTLYFSLEASDCICVCSADLEIQLDVLNSFLAVGNVLESAYLVDEDGTRLDLPVEAFDGVPIADCVQTLTYAYQKVLKS